MNTIQDKAQLIAQDMQATPTPTPSPINIITTIISIITDLMNTFAACGNTPAQAQARMVRPGVVERLTLRSTIRRHTRLIALRTPLFYSSLKVAATLSVPDVTSMMDEVAQSA